MKSKKPKIKGKLLTAQQLQTEILKMFKANARKILNARQIAKKLKVDNSRDSVQFALEALAKSKKLVDIGDYKFKINSEIIEKTETFKPRASTKFYEGKVDMTRTGAAYIIVADLEEDIYVPARSLNGALPNDIVKVSYWKPKGKRRPEGEVQKVLSRAANAFVGTFKQSKHFAFVLPDKQNVPVDFYITAQHFNGAVDGDKVVVKVLEWHGNGRTSPTATVTMVLGQSGSSDLEMKAILINNGFNLEYPAEAIAESESFSEQLSPVEIHRRRDMRGILTFTIDPEDAKDFDDAISYHTLENGNLEIGVHIADVSHYVKPDCALDVEARERATSVYLVDRVLPMLPERLSNGLCSLRPHEDKLTFSAIFEFDKTQKVVNRWFGKTVIHSDHRFTYESAQEVIDGNDDTLKEAILTTNTIAKKLRARRFKAGSIDFDAEEVRFRLDKDGTPIDVYVKERKETHMLVEEFMLLANREVAAFIHQKGNPQEIPFVYRVHDEPNPEKVADLALFAKELGYSMDVSHPKAIAKSYNGLMQATKTNEHLKVLEPLAIRTMSKAEYTTHNIGHYGLGFGDYTHFTSPIRRYSDVLVHRILEGNLGDRTLRVDKSNLESVCKHISAQERKAMEAERESTKYKQVEFLTNKVGQVFKGRISGMIDRGLFVELVDNKCEGMIAFNTLPEPFQLDDSRLKAIGVRTKREIKMGDILNVRILAVDLQKRQIEMEEDF